ncbi:MAG: protease inhibitor I42 family protein [Chloroflexota bacterium]
MKRVFLRGIITILAVPLLLLGCAAPAPPEMPALQGGQEAVTVALSEDTFRAENHIVRDIELVRPGSLIVSLGANPTTGFEWGDAQISASGVVTEQSRVFVPPQTEGSMAGAPGKNVWVFDSLAAGTTTVRMGYSRPWAGGEKDVWTLTLNVTVK